MTQGTEIKTAMALGFFDGVHLGHARLLETVSERAKKLNAKSVVLSFDVAPMEVVTGSRVPLISDATTREEIIRRYFQIDEVVFHHFDATVMAMPWRDFLDSLIGRYSAVHFVIGHDFSCGYRGEGNPGRISDYCASKGVGCDIVPEFRLDGITVSSTHIRGLVAAGDIKNANRFLGHPYCISGRVEGGKKVGRKLGTPTINLRLPPEAIAPAFGVYATKVYVDGSARAAVTNVGVKPTFEEKGNPNVESFIFDFDGDLYGRFVTVDFYDFLRPECKFANADELKAQILRDAEAAKQALEKIIG